MSLIVERDLGLLAEGKELMAEGTVACGSSKGFCPWAWDDIYKFFAVLRQGESLADMRAPKTGVARHTDGVWPVIPKPKSTDQ